MKLSTLVVATATIVAPAIAFAQSSPAPANQSGGGVSPSVQSPTDQGSAGETGNQKGMPARGMMKSGTTGAAVGMEKDSKTTGSGMNSPAAESAKKTESPASPSTGIAKEK